MNFYEGLKIDKMQVDNVRVHRDVLMNPHRYTAGWLRGSTYGDIKAALIGWRTFYIYLHDPN